MGPLLPRAGLNRVHRFVGLSVVGWRRCVPLSLKPVSFGAFPADLVLWALGEAERLGLRVDVLLLDRGFHSVEVALLLKSMGTPFVIGARKTEGIKRLLKGLDKNKLHAVPYRMRGQTPWGREEVEVTLVAYHGRKGWVTLLCWGVEPGEAKKYSLRWGIETCFRMVKRHRARTCSRSLPLRWLLLLTSTLLPPRVPPPRPPGGETAEKLRRLRHHPPHHPAAPPARRTTPRRLTESPPGGGTHRGQPKQATPRAAARPAKPEPRETRTRHPRATRGRGTAEPEEQQKPPGKQKTEKSFRSIRFAKHLIPCFY